MAVNSGAAFFKADSTPPFKVMLIMEQSAQAPSNSMRATNSEVISTKRMSPPSA